MRIGLTQMNTAWADKEKNCIICSELIKKAAVRSVDLLVFPEMTLTGFCMNEELISLDEPEYSREFFLKSSTKFNMAIAYGYTQKTSQGFKNMLSVVSDGRVLSEYAKVHPFSKAEEEKHYTAGDELAFAKLNISAQHWTVGSAICYDLRFPELFQCLSDKAQLILVAANWPKERMDQWNALLCARAVENQCYVCGVNRIGEGNGINYAPSSVLFDPLGKAVTENDASDLLTADIDPEKVFAARKSFPVMNDRRISLYEKWYRGRGKF